MSVTRILRQPIIGDILIYGNKIMDGAYLYIIGRKSLDSEKKAVPPKWNFSNGFISLESDPNFFLFYNGVELVLSFQRKTRFVYSKGFYLLDIDRTKGLSLSLDPDGSYYLTVNKTPYIFLPLLDTQKPYPYQAYRIITADRTKGMITSIETGEVSAGLEIESSWVYFDSGYILDGMCPLYGLHYDKNGKIVIIRNTPTQWNFIDGSYYLKNDKTRGIGFNQSMVSITANITKFNPPPFTLEKNEIVSESSWKLCRFCNLLFDEREKSNCPGPGGFHLAKDERKYNVSLTNYENSLQWNKCSKCQCLVGEGPSVCYDGNEHHIGLSATYFTQSLPKNGVYISDKKTSYGWFKCSLCSCLVNGENSSGCRASGRIHSTSFSPQNMLQIVQNELPQPNVEKSRGGYTTVIIIVSAIVLFMIVGGIVLYLE